MTAVTPTDPRAGTPSIQVRRVETPTGGGALQGMGESFAANEFSGAATLSLPLPASPARDLTPELSVDYSSFAGNGVFGMGFELSLGPVARRTSQGVPLYRDDETFVLDGDVLVPQDQRTEQRGGAAWEVTRYRPRAEGGFDRIERWRHAAQGDTHWRVTSTESVTTLYGSTPGARVSDPGDEARVFEWWPELEWDARGNAVHYGYKRENTENVLDAIWERGRVQTANRYPGRVRYGNVQPYAEGGDPAALAWMFELVFDYGEYDPAPSNDDPFVPVRPWPARPDAFSSYDAGFERRTHRLCRNVLLFHRFEEIAPLPVLVQRMRFAYDEQPDLTRLVAVERIGYRYRGDAPAGRRYTVAALPTVRMAFTPFEPGGGEWRPLRAAGGGDLAGAALEPATTVLDLYGDGMPGLFYAQGETVRYARPALAADGAVEYAAEAPRPFPVARTPAGTAALADLDGNGRLDVVVADPGRAGFHPGELGRFGAFVPFELFPSAVAPQQQHADLTGDGRADLVVVEPGAVRVSPSLGARGYGAATPAPRRPGLPVSTPDSGVELLSFANVLGIGGENRVRVRDGVVECWPSLGYGRFGAGVVLGGAPRFAEFDPARVRWVDVDGSGTADLAYVHPDRVEVYRNLSGNAFAAEPIVVALPAPALTPAQVSFADVDGSGCQSLVYAELLPPARQWWHPLAGPGGKPYLLSSVQTGLGGRTTVRYQSSARYQLEDRRDGLPWITSLPFPVQLVAEVEVEDPVSQAVSRAAYRYHHGWYDPVEREYRGFGMVERWDTDRATADAPPGGPAVLAPSLTRTWFLTGCWELEAALMAQYRREFWSGDPRAYPMPPSVFEWLAPPSPAAERQARAALAGSALRTEVFGVDGGPRSGVPYSVSESSYTVRELQPIGQSRYGVFLATGRELIMQAYEREAADPRTQHEFALRYDAFANVERTATVSYRRRADAPGIIEPQTQTWITCDVATYVPPRQEPAVYLAGLPLEQREYEVLDAPPPGVEGLYYSFAEMEALVEAALRGGDPGGPRAELVGRGRMVWEAEGGGTVPPGPVAAQALLVRAEQAAFEDAWIHEVFAPTPVSGELTELLRGDGGYRLDGEGMWWLPGPTQRYAGADAFFVPTSVADPFAADPASPRPGTTVTYTWDRYALAVLATQATPSAPDVLAARSEVLDFDYQTLTALKVRDANGLTSQVLQDPLGRVVAASHWGREIHGGAAVRVGFTELPADGAWPEPASLAGLVADPAAYLRGAAAFTYYDFPAAGGPPSVTTLAAPEYPDPADPDRPRGPISISVTYADGLGRGVQETRKAEPGPGIVTSPDGQPVVGANGQVERGELDERWLTSGRVRYNAKGQPFRQFEPFYIGTWRFVSDPSLQEFGVSPTLRYDPLGRLVRTDLPRGPFQDAFFTTVEYGAWEQTAWDADDTVTQSNYYRYFIGENHPLPELERAALLAAAAFAGTPGTARLDALGRPAQQVARLAGEGGMEELVTHLGYLVTGETLWSAEPRLFAAGVRNFENVYALDGAVVQTVSADAGTGWALADVVGGGLVSIGPRGYVTLPAYDSRQRVIAVRVRPPAGAPFVSQRTVYGDSLDAEGGTVVDPAGRNVLGLPVVVYDEAGAGSTLAYSIGGEPLAGEQRLVADLLAPPDWAGSAPTWAALFAALDAQLEAERFGSSFAYDALGRSTERTDPDGNRWRETWDVAGLLATVSIQPPGQAERPYVRGIAYNPRGDRERVEYGDPDGALLLTTTYAYDPYDFRLTGLRTVRATDAAVLQEMGFWYDPVGNPMFETDAAAPGAAEGSTRAFRYDSLYRLAGSTGRAHPAYTRADLRTGSYSPYFAATKVHPNDGGATEAYEMAYAYDPGNNLTRLAFLSPSSRWTQTLAVAPTSNRAVEEPENGGGVPADAFDAAGNPLYLDGIPALAWDHRGALQAAVTVQRAGGDPDAVFSTYSASGQRVRKVWQAVQAGGTVSEVTIYLGPFEIHRTVAGGRVVNEYRRLRVMDADRCVVQWLRWTVGGPPGGGSPDQHRYQLDDRLGSSVMEVDARGLLLSYEEYAAYGGTTWAAGESLAEVSRKHYRFSDKERDRATGLSYFGARYYAPWLGRWISPDPAGPVDGLNLYEYVSSNPASYVDPLGFGKRVRKKKTAPAKKPRKTKTATALSLGIKSPKYKQGTKPGTIVIPFRQSTRIDDRRKELAKQFAAPVGAIGHYYKGTEITLGLVGSRSALNQQIKQKLDADIQAGKEVAGIDKTYSTTASQFFQAKSDFLQAVTETVTSSQGLTLRRPKYAAAFITPRDGAAPKIGAADPHGGIDTSRDDRGHLVPEKGVSDTHSMSVNSSDNVIAENWVINQIFKTALEEGVKQYAARSGAHVVTIHLPHYTSSKGDDASFRARPKAVTHMVAVNGVIVSAFTFKNSKHVIVPRAQ